MLTDILLNKKSKNIPGLFYEFAQTSTLSNTIKAVRTMPTWLKYFTFTLS